MTSLFVKISIALRQKRSSSKFIAALTVLITALLWICVFRFLRFHKSKNSEAAWEETMFNIRKIQEIKDTCMMPMYDRLQQSTLKKNICLWC